MIFKKPPIVINRLNVAWVAFLAILFFTSYSATNHVQAYLDKLHGLPTVSFNWEQLIPFVPLFIYPYMSIDFLYGLAFFIRQKTEYPNTVYKKNLNILGLQLLTNQVLSLLCFLAFPCKLSYQKPIIPERYTSIFNALLSFDLPYNLAPSLHISITVILWQFYSRHLQSKKLLILLKIWFLLIVGSVLFCYQHQVWDVLTGFVMGVLIVTYLTPGVLLKPLAWKKAQSLFVLTLVFIFAQIAGSFFAFPTLPPIFGLSVALFLLALCLSKLTRT